MAATRGPDPEQVAQELAFDDIDELKERAKPPPIDSAVSLKHYYRTAAQLQLLADSYGLEENYEYQYIYLLRFTTYVCCSCHTPPFPATFLVRHTHTFPPPCSPQPLCLAPARP